MPPRKKKVAEEGEEEDGAGVEAPAAAKRKPRGGSKSKAGAAEEQGVNGAGGGAKARKDGSKGPPFAATEPGDAANADDEEPAGKGSSIRRSSRAAVRSGKAAEEVQVVGKQGLKRKRMPTAKAAEGAEQEHGEEDSDNDDAEEGVAEEAAEEADGDEEEGAAPKAAAKGKKGGKKPAPKKAKAGAGVTATATRDMEKALWTKGYTSVGGVDEAGRGPLAGPVVAAVCVLPRELDIQLPGVEDSKTLDEAEREAAYEMLTTTPGVQWAVQVMDHRAIDRLNILQATMTAMREAACKLPAGAADYLLVDGNRLPKDLPVPGETVVKGDARCTCIAAASILAKVTRDRLMVQLDKEYPQYGFAQHKGYGVPAHLAAIQEHGPCDIHRRSFQPIRGITGWTREAQLAEEAAAAGGGAAVGAAAAEAGAAGKAQAAAQGAGSKGRGKGRAAGAGAGASGGKRKGGAKEAAAAGADGGARGGQEQQDEVGTAGAQEAPDAAPPPPKRGRKKAGAS